jgi:hypothetical protein
VLVASCSSFHLAFGQRFRLHLQVDLRIDVGSPLRHVAQPAADRIDVHTRPEQMRGGRVPNDVWADLLVGN